jgi:hypothetical protein
LDFIHAAMSYLVHSFVTTERDGYENIPADGYNPHDGDH